MHKQEIEKDIAILKYYETQQQFFENDMPALNAFRRAISALEQQLNDAWIPVSGRLPTSDGRFEVTVKSTKGKRHVEMCNFYKDASFEPHKWGGKYESVNVIAWRSRPHPFKEEVNGVTSIKGNRLCSYTCMRRAESD